MRVFTHRGVPLYLYFGTGTPERSIELDGSLSGGLERIDFSHGFPGFGPRNFLSRIVVAKMLLFEQKKKKKMMVADDFVNLSPSIRSNARQFAIRETIFTRSVGEPL